MYAVHLQAIGQPKGITSSTAHAAAGACHSGHWPPAAKLAAEQL